MPFRKESSKGYSYYGSRTSASSRSYAVERIEGIKGLIKDSSHFYDFGETRKASKAIRKTLKKAEEDTKTHARQHDNEQQPETTKSPAPRFTEGFKEEDEEREKLLRPVYKVAQGISGKRKKERARRYREANEALKEALKKDAFEKIRPQTTEDKASSRRQHDATHGSQKAGKHSDNETKE